MRTHRRAFLAALSASLAGATWRPRAALSQASGADLSVARAVDMILERIPGPRRQTTVDTFKAGDPARPLKGIGTTFLATCGVIERAAEAGCNLLITHEPTFYNHADDTDWLENDPVYARKRSLLKDTGVVVWRFHDYWHQEKPDPVTAGLLRAFGWDGCAAQEDNRVCLREPLPLNELASRLKRNLQARQVRYVGRSDLPCRLIGVLPGAHGWQSQMTFLRGVDVLICGEINEWETNIYAADAAWAGIPKGLIIVGHVDSEEPGMAYLAGWLRELFPRVPVRHLPAGDPFVYV